MPKIKINYIIVNTNSYGSITIQGNTFDVDMFKDTILSKTVRPSVLLNSRMLKSLTFRNNLIMIDSKMPELLEKVKSVVGSFKTLTMREFCELLRDENPLHFDQRHGHPFYELRLKNLLLALALGMNIRQIWDGSFAQTELYAVLKQAGDSKTHEFLTISQFVAYLFYHTVVEVSSPSNFQIRFM